MSLDEIMNNYNVWQLVAAVSKIRDLEVLLEKLCDQSNMRDVYIRKPFISQMVRPALDYCRDQCQKIELHGALHRLGGVLWGNVNAGALTHQELQVQLRELRREIDRELALRRFAFVPLAKAEIHDKFTLHWESAWTVIPESKADTIEAIDCYALGLNTATVFHSMRVAEKGLRRLASRLRVALIHKGHSSPLEYAEWDPVLTACKNKLSEAHKLPKGPRREKQLQFYSEAADHCTYMKDIWRNNVSHARKTYNDGEALGAFNRVHDFMDFLAKGLKK